MCNEDNFANIEYSGNILIRNSHDKNIKLYNLKKTCLRIISDSSFVRKYSVAKGILLQQSTNLIILIVKFIFLLYCAVQLIKQDTSANLIKIN